MASTGGNSGKDHLSLTRGLSGIGEPLFMLTSPGRPNMAKSAALNTAPVPGRYGAAQNFAAIASKPLESSSFSFSTVPEPSRLELSPSIGPSRMMSPATPSASPTTTARRGPTPTSTAVPMQNGMILSRALDLASQYRRQIMELYMVADASEVPVLMPEQPMPVKDAYAHLPAAMRAGDGSPDAVSAWIQAVARAQCKAWQEAALQLHYLQQQDTWRIPANPPPMPVAVGPEASSHGS